jgi:hypothetical protein
VTFSRSIDAQLESDPTHAAELLVLSKMVELLRPHVAVSWFSWFKPPGNAYFTLFPLGLLPTLADKRAWQDADLGEEIFEWTTTSSMECGANTTMAMYGGPECLVPVDGAGGLSVLRFEDLGCGRDDMQMQHAAETWLKVIDVDFLRSRGGPDPDATDRVVRWTDRIYEEVNASRSALEQYFLGTRAPVCLIVAESVLSGTNGHEFWLEDYEGLWPLY